MSDDSKAEKRAVSGVFLEIDTGGITIRDLFAGLVINGIASIDSAGFYSPEDIPKHARHAYRMADAMMRAREEKSGTEE